MRTSSPGYREDDSWFSEAQLAQVAPADAAETFRSPVPTQMVSNGEYMPCPQTEKQKRVEARIKELTHSASRHLGISRRQFLAGAGGMAAAFLAMNEVFGKTFDVSPIEMFEPAAFAAKGVPRDLFVFDTQLHTIRSSRNFNNLTLRAIAQGAHSSLNPLDLPDELGGVDTPWNPAIAGLPNVSENFYLVQFMKDVYLDSQVTVGLMSNNTGAAVPDVGGSRPPKNVIESEAGEFLSAPQTAAVRDWVNRLAGSTRMLAHGQVYPGLPGRYPPGTPVPTNLEYMQWQIDVLKPDSWKGYTSANSAKEDLDPESLMRRWTLDEELTAYPMYEHIVRNRHMLKAHPGFFNICIHKGLSTTAPDNPALGFPTDIPPAARDWPMLNFIIYHSCIRPGFWMLNALNDVRSGQLRAGVPDILWTTQFAVDSAPYRNIYAELGTIFASCVITFPTVCAHILGQLMKFMGEHRIVFGSDSVWYGSPQWQIEALWRFEIPETLRERYGYPELTKAAKRKILGLNSARLYGLHAGRKAVRRGVYRPVPADYESRIPDELKTILEFPEFAADTLSKMKATYLAAGGQRSNVRYGWIRTRV
jgi:predicted TIM-barrel fold metal-dependent hydrolase